MRRNFAGFALVLAALFVCVPAHASSVQPIAEEMFVPIGGVQQWITIKGDNRDNPVILYLHGGPGDAMSPYGDAMFAAWRHDFTMVQWDQRGAGRTFTKNGAGVAPTLTVERMTEDGIEVAQYLIAHLHKRKIILVGGSWGSVLGIHMAHARPELLYAYVGLAQMVNWQKNVAASYARVLALAQAAHDEPAVAALTALGAPPWDDVHKWPQFRKVERAYQAKVQTAPDVPGTIDPAYASDAEREQYEAADDFSFIQFWGMKLSGPFTQVDLLALGTDFQIPIYVIQGEQDLTAVPEIARAYVDSLHAPRKGFYLVPGTGHEPSVPQHALAFRILMDLVRPMATP